MSDHNKILVLDDDKNITFILETLLKYKNYAVETLHDSTKAIEGLGQNKYDLIIIDYMMPGLNGLELAKEIRAHEEPQVKDIKILLLTAKRLDQDELEKVSKYNLKYERKPINPAAFQNNILSILSDD